jgi:glycogen synthase
MKRAMARNFSWDASAQRYEALYKELVGETDQVAA